MEKFGDSIDRIAFIMPDATQELTFLELLPLYFPRNKSEEIIAKQLLPEDTGDENGAPVVEERKIRIASVPGMDGEAATGAGGAGGAAAGAGAGLASSPSRRPAPLPSVGSGAGVMAVKSADLAADSSFGWMRDRTWWAL